MSARSRNCVPTLPFSEGTKLIVTCAATQLNDMDATLASLIAQMHSIAKVLPEYDVVMSMYGVGYVLGPQLIAEIGDISRFKKKQSLAAYADVDPEQKQSGKNDPTRTYKNFSTIKIILYLPMALDKYDNFG